MTVGWGHLLSAAVDTHDNRPHNLMVLPARLHRPRSDACPSPAATVVSVDLGLPDFRVKARAIKSAASRGQQSVCVTSGSIAALHPLG